MNDAGGSWWASFLSSLKGKDPNDVGTGMTADGQFGFTPSSPDSVMSSVNPNVGREQFGKAAALQGAASLIDGFKKEEEDRQNYNRDLAFRNASMQQAYQNNLPAMFKVRQGARQSANALASLGGL